MYITVLDIIKGLINRIIYRDYFVILTEINRGDSYEENRSVISAIDAHHAKSIALQWCKEKEDEEKKKWVIYQITRL